MQAMKIYLVKNWMNYMHQILAWKQLTVILKFSKNSINYIF